MKKIISLVLFVILILGCTVDLPGTVEETNQTINQTSDVSSMARGIEEPVIEDVPAPTHTDFVMDGIPVRIISGRETPAVYNPENRGVRMVNTSVVPAGPGVNESLVNQTREHLEFSWNFYKNLGFNEPELGPDGVFDITITQGGGYNGLTYPNGSIHFDLGNVSEINKWTIEHEFFHAIQYKRQGDGFRRMNPISEAFLDEGLAEYFSSRIAEEQFNISYDTLLEIVYNESLVNPNMSIPTYVGRRNIDGLTGGFFNSWHDWCYEEAHALMRYIAEKYGEAKLAHIHNVTQNYGLIDHVGTLDTVGKAAIQKAFDEQPEHNVTFEDLFVDWISWMYDKYGGDWIISETLNASQANYSETSVEIMPWGTHFERYNISGDGPLNIVFKGDSLTDYGITIVLINRDGTKTKTTQRISEKLNHTVNNTTNISQVILIKSQIDKGGRTSYNLTLDLQNPGNNTIQNDTVINGTAPIVEEVQMTQLHDYDYDEIYKYLLESYIRLGDNPTYYWETTCGYFYGNTNESMIEWRYNRTVTNCSDALITLRVTNINSLYDVYDYYPWGYEEELAPTIEGISWVQLHEDPEVFPHKYELTATITSTLDPSYQWDTTCGYFVGDTDSYIVEWWYDSWECSDTLIGLRVENSNGLYDLFEYDPWE